MLMGNEFIQIMQEVIIMSRPRIYSEEELRERRNERMREYAKAHKEELKAYNAAHKERRNEYSLRNGKKYNDATREMATNDHARWTPEEDLRMMVLFDKGLTNVEVAMVLNRTLKSVQNRKASLRKKYQ